MGGLDFTAIDDAIGEISLGNRDNFVKYTFAELICMTPLKFQIKLKENQ